MKKAKIIVITGLIAIILFAFVVAVSMNRKNSVTARTVNFIIEESKISSISLANFDVKDTFTGSPQMDTIFDIYLDKFDNSVWQLGYDNANKIYKIHFTNLNTKEEKDLKLKKREADLIAGGKILSDEHNIYAGIEDTLFIVNKKTWNVKSRKLPIERFKIDEQLVPDKNFVRNNYIIDMEKIGNNLAISRNCSTALLFYNLESGDFSTLKLPPSFGTVNELLGIESKDLLFVTNFYSGKKDFTIRNKFGCLNLKTNEFDIFELPIDYLFAYKEDVYGVSPSEGLIKLDKNFKKIESTNINNLNLLSPIIPSDMGLWFIGSDITINDFSDEVLPVNNTKFYYSADITKPVEYVGLFSPKDKSIIKYYLPLFEAGSVYGGSSLDLEKINKEPRKGFELITKILPGKDNSVILIKGFGKALEVKP
ncbi:hypothetical protein [Caldisericum sp.]|uniref:hypothetical protein n=1 Tax=Caldisericum sp. TaxID=2499687 RepID=UPI003D12826D